MSSNPRASVLAGPGAFVAGPAGVFVGRFAWVNQGDYTQVANSGAGTPDGFVHREQQALITAWLAEATMLVPRGNIITLHSAGDFWVRNAGGNPVTPRMKAYAMFGGGAVAFGPTGVPPVGPGGSFTAANAAGAGTSTLSTIADNVLTVGGALTGTFNPGGTLAGAGVAAGTQITSQLTGAPGGAGTYLVMPRNQQITTPQPINETHGILTVTAVASGSLSVGDVLSAPPGAIVTAYGTGTGGLGTYVTNSNAVAASGPVTTPGCIETKWYAMASADVGELVPMSSWPLG